MFSFVILFLRIAILMVDDPIYIFSPISHFIIWALWCCEKCNFYFNYHFSASACVM